MINTKDISNLELAAITRAQLSKEARDSIAPGKYPVNFIQKVTGTVTVGKPSSRVRTCNLLGKRVLALCFHHMGIQKQNIEPLLDLILDQAVNGNQDFLDKIENDPRVIAALDRLDKRISKADKLPVAGKITADLVFNTVNI